LRRLDLYVLRDFLLYSLMGLTLFVGIFVIVDAIEKIDTFVDHHAAADMILRYYLWGMPVVLVQVFPLAVLLGSILSLGQMRRFNEVTAMQGAGISPLRIAAPLLLASLLIAVGVYLLAEIVVPDAYRAQNRILKVDIKGQEPEERAGRMNVRYLGQGGVFYMIEYFDGATGSLRNVSVQTLTSHGIARRIDAQHARIQDGLWHFEKGFLRTFRDSTETSVRFDGYATSSLREVPADFARPEGNPFQMNMKELRHYAERVRASGARDVKIRVDYNLRVSFPLASLIMVLLGTSLSLRIVRGGNVALGFGTTIFLGFTYYAFLRTGQALGYNGALPPAAAAWMGNLLFATIGSLIFWKVTR
jgi:lipopolysaccharide export system permease protein